jgi:tRNA(His) 5'-end guanylyltransferase
MPRNSLIQVYCEHTEITFMLACGRVTFDIRKDVVVFIQASSLKTTLFVDS